MTAEQGFVLRRSTGRCEQNRGYNIVLDWHDCEFAEMQNVRYSMVTLRQLSRRGGTGRRDRLRIYYR